MWPKPQCWALMKYFQLGQRFSDEFHYYNCCSCCFTGWWIQWDRQVERAGGSHVDLGAGGIVWSRSLTLPAFLWRGSGCHIPSIVPWDAAGLTCASLSAAGCQTHSVGRRCGAIAPGHQSRSVRSETISVTTRRQTQSLLSQERFSSSFIILFL